MTNSNKTKDFDNKKECEHFWMPLEWRTGSPDRWVTAVITFYCAKCKKIISYRKFCEI
jgi:hypothetical protein